MVYVVSEHHTFGSDDYVKVPSAADFEKLDDSVREIKKSVSSCKISVSSFERKMETAEKQVVRFHDQVKEMSSAVKGVKAEMVAELKGGEWRKILDSAVLSATKSLEKALQEAGRVSAEKISTIAQFDVRARKANEDLDRRKSELDDLWTKLRDCEESFKAIEVTCKDSLSKVVEQTNANMRMGDDAERQYKQIAAKSEELKSLIEEKEVIMSRLQKMEERSKRLLWALIAIAALSVALPFLM